MYRLFLVIVLIGQIGCVSRLGSENSLGKFDFSYKVLNERCLGLLSVFNDGENTYFKFIGSKTSKPLVYEKLNNPYEVLSFNHSTYYINKVPDKLSLKRDKCIAHVVRQYES